MNTFQLDQHELDAKRISFMKRKMHQFPELKNEPHYIESVETIKPVEKHLKTVKRSHTFSYMGFAHGMN